MTTATLTATYGIWFIDRHGDYGYVQRDAHDADHAAQQVRADYPGASVTEVEVAYVPPTAS